MAMNDLPKRAATALIFVVVMVGGVIWNRYTFLALTTLITAGCLWEYYGLVSKVQTYKEEQKMFWRIFYSALGFIVFLVFIPASDWVFHGGVYLVLPLISVGMAAELYAGERRSIQNAALNLLGIIYLVIPFVILHYLTFRLFSSEAWFPNISGIILGMLCLVWTNDTMAYFTGRFLGRNKLFPSVSPRQNVGRIYWRSCVLFGNRISPFEIFQKLFSG